MKLSTEDKVMMHNLDSEIDNGVVRKVDTHHYEIATTMCYSAKDDQYEDVTLSVRARMDIGFNIVVSIGVNGQVFSQIIATRKYAQALFQKLYEADHERHAQAYDEARDVGRALLLGDIKI
jgi:hypothetical protein